MKENKQKKYIGYFEMGEQIKKQLNEEEKEREIIEKSKKEVNR